MPIGTAVISCGSDEGEQEAAKDIERSERDDQRRQLQGGDEESIDQSERETDRPGDHEGDQDRIAHAERDHRLGADVHREGGDRGERYVDAAGGENQEDADREQRGDDAVSQQIEQGGKREEARLRPGDAAGRPQPAPGPPMSRCVRGDGASRRTQPASRAARAFSSAAARGMSSVTRPDCMTRMRSHAASSSGMSSEITITPMPSAAS